MKTEITFERLPSMMYLREAFIAPVLMMERCILTKDRQVAAGRFFGWTDLKTDVLRKE